MKTTRILAKIATKINTRSLVRIDWMLTKLRCYKLRSIVRGEVFSRNDLFETF